MNYFKFLTKTVFTAALVFSMSSQIASAFGSLDEPYKENEPKEDWAPMFRWVIHPVYLDPVLLIKDYETSTTAFYKVSPVVPPPKNAICTDDPKICELSRDDYEDGNP